MRWGTGWYQLRNGLGIYLPEARTCSCGEHTKVITRDAASCPVCKAKDLRGETVVAYLDCRTGAVTAAVGGSGRTSTGRGDIRARPSRGAYSR
jgi:hypothetical protein